MSFRLIRDDDNAVIFAHVELADSFWKRFKGLQFRSALPADSAVWLRPCSSLHTCFMRFAIDLIMIDDDGVVIGIRKAVRPWRAVICDRGTTGVIEANVGAVEILPGTRLRLVANLDAPSPQSPPA